MATVPIHVPDEIVNDLVDALALRLRRETPDTDAGRIELAQMFFSDAASSALLDYKAAEAAKEARVDPTSNAVKWRQDIDVKLGKPTASDGGEIVGTVTATKTSASTRLAVKNQATQGIRNSDG